jgi:hypothetical protein
VATFKSGLETVEGTVMESVSVWSEADTAEAKRVWHDYQKTHDVTPFKGQAAGIEPESRRVWFGESGLDVVQKMKAEGLDRPLFFVRVGYDSYLRKGGRR